MRKAITKNGMVAFLLAVAMLVTLPMSAYAAESASGQDTASAAATKDATVPAGVTPVKSYTAKVGTSYKLPDDIKKAGDTYESSANAILTVNKEIGVFKPVKDGVAYIVATNAGAKRYIKVTAGSGVVQATTNTTSSGALVGYTVIVNDKTTAAVNIWSGDTAETRETMYFRSAAGTTVGSISRTAYNAIMQKNQKTVSLSGGGTYGAPPIDGKSWEVWFADEFNVYRGLGTESRSNASDEAKAELSMEMAQNGEEFRTEVIRLTNVEREKVGLPAYEYDNQLLNDLAQTRAKELSVLYSHTRPDGTGSGTENIAAGASSPTDVVSRWMNSPGHKANILKRANDPKNGILSCTHIAVGYYYDVENNASYWVQLFGYGPDNN